MKSTFEKIEKWLKENADKIIEFSLQEPATEVEIHELERVINKSLPKDFKELYLWHNGLGDNGNFGSLFFGMDFYPIDRILEEYNSKGRYTAENISLKNADKEIDKTNIYNLDWVKFAFDGSHTSLYLDLKPTNEGKYGQIIFIDDEYEMGILVADSTSELVENFAKDLESNLYHLNEDALEDDNHYLETDQTIDVVNWQSSERWKR
ncbi:MAG: SMI1/KNR4 family protein [Sporocytophaga sp.]|uniref:SMI1/KNR4 family protein n=1 Tax=Sporocytophaga sp. TaxID=2231183 RepID=UPI001B0F05C3|nr:SMI1/KNR4 family protein [Sporocytophaga sp.]MBO9700131.1 SMI1/KNR4 family protein [Sporocytophaga sp.]